MDFINRATGRTGPLPDGMPFAKIFDLGHIDTRIQKHLQRVSPGCVGYAYPGRRAAACKEQRPRDARKQPAAPFHTSLYEAHTLAASSPRPSPRDTPPSRPPSTHAPPRYAPRSRAPLTSRAHPPLVQAYNYNA